MKEENKRLKKTEEDYYDFLQKKNEEDWKGDNVVGCLNLRIEQKDKQIADLTLKISRLESDCDAYNYSQRTYQEEIKELKAENEQIKNSDTLCKLIGEQKRKITELEQQIEKMKCCSNCDNWNWKHNKCEKKLKGDCFKHSKWVMRNF